MKKMLLFTVLIIFAIILLCTFSCSGLKVNHSNVPEGRQVNHSNVSGVTDKLVPFRIRSEEYGYLRGYVNFDTLEVVIPADYETAMNFTGDFAFVYLPKEKRVNPKSWGRVIINKNNDIIFKNFWNIELIESEDGLTVYALTSRSRGRYAGLYNAAKNEWAIPPFQTDPHVRVCEFTQTEVENVILYHERF